MDCAERRAVSKQEPTTWTMIKTKTTYLQMFEPPRVRIPAPYRGVVIERHESPSVDFYRHLYRSVGETYHWVDRIMMPDDELRAIIQDDRVDVWVLYVAGKVAGYAELDRRSPGEIELAYLGLFPEAIGKGLGKYLLNWVLHAAWSHKPQRVWVHTCDLDHPAALANYLRAGLRVYKEEMVDQRLPND